MKLRLSGPLAFDPYARNRETGIVHPDRRGDERHRRRRSDRDAGGVATPPGAEADAARARRRGRRGAPAARVHARRAWRVAALLRAARRSAALGRRLGRGRRRLRAAVHARLGLRVGAARRARRLARRHRRLAARRRRRLAAVLPRADGVRPRAAAGADGWLAPTHFLPQADVDAWLFGGTVPTVWLQAHLHDPGRVQWFEVAAFPRLRLALLRDAAGGRAAVAARPLALPSLCRIACAADAAGLHHVRRLSGGAAVDGERARADSADRAADPAAVDVDRLFGAEQGVVGTGYRYANDVAAVPSLHAALRAAGGAVRLAAALVGARCSWRPIRSRWRSRSSTPASTTSPTCCSAGSTPSRASRRSAGSFARRRGRGALIRATARPLREGVTLSFRAACSPRSWSPTAARSPSASSARCEELGIASVAVYSELDRDALHVAARRRGLPARPRAGGRELPEDRQDHRGREESGADAVHPGYGFLAENAAFAARLRGGRDHLHRPAGERDRRDGLQDRGARADAGRRRADRPRHHRAGRDARGRRAQIARDEIGFPVAVKAAGGGGGKGFRVALSEDELEDAFEGASREGEKFFSDADRLPRALPARPAPRRGPDPRRPPRQRHPPRRARLLDPAPPPEADRGVARPGRRRGAARADRQDRRRRGGGRRLRRRRHDRGPAAGRRVLLPGDEHARPGRALRDRDDDRHRHRPRGHPRRRGRAAVDHARTTSALRGHAIECRINAEDASKNFAPAPGKIGAYKEPVGPRRARRLGRRPGRRGHADVRPDGRQADRLGRRPRAGDAAHAARAGRVRDRGLKTLIPFHDALLATEQWAQRRDLPRPRRGQGVAEGARVPAARRRGDDERGREGRARLHGRGLRPALRRQGHRAARSPARGGAGAAVTAPGAASPKRAASASPAAAAAGGDLLRLAAAGQHVEGARRAGRRRSRRASSLHHRGDEDGERDHRPQGGGHRELPIKEGEAIAAGDPIAVIKSAAW